MSAINALRDWWYGPECRYGITSMEAAKAIGKALHDAGYVIVPIKPNERMLEELSRIGDGPMITGEECWGYMLAAAVADDDHGDSGR